jgi:hypothetical protein
MSFIGQDTIILFSTLIAFISPASMLLIAAFFIPTFGS